jgi:hypothetical protein
MKKSLLTRTFLVLSGLVAAGIGGALLFVPVEFHASSGIILENDVNLLSEMRAPGGFMFAVGILIMLGAWINNMAAASLVMSCLLFLSYGFSRLLGMVFDGIPNETLLTATAFEFGIGLLGLFILVRSRGNQPATYAGNSKIKPSSVAAV